MASAPAVARMPSVVVPHRRWRPVRCAHPAGTRAATFRKLANAGVNADLLLPVRVSDALFFAVICVDDQDQARQALGAQVIPPGSRPVALAAVPGPGPGRSPSLPRSQRHRSYPRNQTTRPAVIPAPGLASTPDGKRIAGQQPPPITERKTDPILPSLPIRHGHLA